MHSVKYGFGLYDAVDVPYFIKPHRVQKRWIFDNKFENENQSTDTNFVSYVQVQ